MYVKATQKNGVFVRGNGESEPEGAPGIVGTSGSMARCVINNTKVATMFAFHAAPTAPIAGAG